MPKHLHDGIVDIKTKCIVRQNLTLTIPPISRRISVHQDCNIHQPKQLIAEIIGNFSFLNSTTELFITMKTFFITGKVVKYTWLDLKKV